VRGGWVILYIEDDVDRVCRNERFRLSPGNQPWTRVVGRPGHRWEDNVRMDFRGKG